MRRRKFDREAYVTRVTAYLSGQFGWSSITEGVCRGLLRLHNDRIDPRLELICDDTVAANWRLKSVGRGGHPWGLRMSYYGQNESRFDYQRRMSHDLARILEEVEEVQP